MRIRFAAVAALVASAAFITEFASADQYFFRARGTISATSPGGSNGPGDEVSLPPGGTPQNDPLIAQGTPPTDSYVGEDVAYAFTASGGIAPYTWSLSGSLPPGLTLTSDGTLSGTPSTQAAGQTYSFNVTVTDAVNQQHSIGPFTVSVAPLLSVKRGIQKGCYAGWPPEDDQCTGTFEARNAFGEIEWSVVNAPDGFVITPQEGSNSIVVVRPDTWTPPFAPATFQYTIVAKDSGGSVGSASGTISVNYRRASSAKPSYMSIAGVNRSGWNVCHLPNTGPYLTTNVKADAANNIIEQHYDGPIVIRNYGRQGNTKLDYVSSNFSMQVEVFDGNDWVTVYTGPNYTASTVQFPEIIGTKVRATVLTGEITVAMLCPGS